MSRLPTIAAFTARPYKAATTRPRPASIATAARTNCCRRAIRNRACITRIFPRTCGACHSQKFVMQDSGQSAQMVASYEQSVHGHAVAAGSEKAAVCTDCHGTHEILDAKDAKSPIFKFNVPTTCGQCHDADLQGIHSRAFTGKRSPRATGRRRCAPTATAFTPSSRTLDPNSPVSAQNLASGDLCALPRRHAALAGVRSRRPPRDHVPGQLSRTSGRGRLAGRRQLRQLPRHAQHSSRRAIRGRRSTMPTSRAPAASAIPA